MQKYADICQHLSHLSVPPQLPCSQLTLFSLPSDKHENGEEAEEREEDGCVEDNAPRSLITN